MRTGANGPDRSGMRVSIAWSRAWKWAGGDAEARSAGSMGDLAEGGGLRIWSTGGDGVTAGCVTLASG